MRWIFVESGQLCSPEQELIASRTEKSKGWRTAIVVNALKSKIGEETHCIVFADRLIRISPSQSRAL